MRFFRKFIAVYISLSILVSCFPGLNDVFTAKARAVMGGPLRLVAASDPETGTRLINPTDVVLEWDAVPGASYELKYYTSAGVAVTVNSGFNLDASRNRYSYKVENLSKDFVYNFTVTADIGGTVLTDSLKVITGITFEAVNLPQTPVSLPGGGKEIGAIPKMKFRWKMPRTYDESLGIVEYDRRAIDFNIFIGTDTKGTNRNPIKVRFSETVGASGEYLATRTEEGRNIKTIAQSVDITPDGYVEFVSEGVDDPSPLNPLVTTPVAENPAYDGAETGFDADNVKDLDTLPAGSVSLKEIYRNPDLTPGTVLRMSIEPVFNDELNPDGTSNVAYVTSPILEGYTYTSVRFRLEKDTSNNIVATIYKINQDGRSDEDRVSFSYQVQYSVNPDFTNPIISARQRDEFTPGNTLTIYIVNTSGDHTMYYRVIATAPVAGQTLYSGVIDYAASMDTSLPPLPQDLQVEAVVPVSGMVDDTFYGDPPQGSFEVKSGNIKIKWKKPANYDELMAINDTDPLYFNILISSSQVDMPGKTERIDYIFGDVSKSKTYEIRYRQVLKVNLAACDVEGDYLVFVIDGLKLFQTIEGKTDPSLPLDLHEPYDNLVVIPSPEMNTDSYPTYLLPNKSYYIKMFSSKGQKVSSDSIPSSFTTPLDAKKNPPAPTGFTVIRNEITKPEGINSVTLEWQKISFNLSEYTLDLSVPYSVYYDLYMSNTMDDPDEFVRIGTTENPDGDVVFGGLSDASNIINATIGRLSEPDAVNKFGDGLKPNATYYFKVYTRVIIGTETRISKSTGILAVTTLKGDIVPPGEEEKRPRVPDDPENNNRFSIALDQSGNRMVDSNSVVLRWPELESDVRYTLIRTSLRIAGNATIEEISQNPENQYKAYLMSAQKPAVNGDFAYNGEKKEFTFKARDLYPNTVYFFSVRAERIINPGQPDEKVIVSPWATIPVTTALIEEPTDLEIVTEGFEIDDKHEIAVRWIGKDGYRYEIAIRSENESSFTTLSEYSGFRYLRIEKPAELAGTDYSVYYARILYLDSNTRYYIRVRSFVYNSITNSHDYSKYTPQISYRTEFSQEDYDKEEEDKKQRDRYADKVKFFNQIHYWILEDSSSVYKIMLRKSKVENFIKYSPDDSYTVNLSASSYGNAPARGVYIPLSVVETLEHARKNLVIKSPGVEFIFRPDSISKGNSTDIEKVFSNVYVRDAYIYIEIKSLSGSERGLPAGSVAVSDVSRLNVEVVGTRDTSDEIDQRAGNILDYYIRTGLTMLIGTPQGNKNTLDKLDKVIENIVENIHKSFQSYMRLHIEGTYGVIRTRETIDAFGAPLSATMPLRNLYEDRLKTAYFNRNNKWETRPSTYSYVYNTVTFDIIFPGKLAVLGEDGKSGLRVPRGHWAEKDITAFVARYDIRDIFTQSSRNGINSPVTVAESIQVFGKVLGGYKPEASATEIAREAGLSGAIRLNAPKRNLSREELACLLVRAYELMTGVKTDTLRPGNMVYIGDESGISGDCRQQVEICVQLKLMDLDEKNEFRPKDASSQADLISSLSRMLRLLGRL